MTNQDGYLVLDVEGTNLFDFKKPADAPGQPRACAIGLIFLDENYEITEERYALIRPNGWVLDPEGEAARINGLTMERLEADGVPITEMLEPYHDGIRNGRIVAGHNVAGYDLKIMRAEARHAGVDDLYMTTRSICTMFGTRAICGLGKVPKLEEMARHFGIDPGEKHTAIDDARVVAKALKKCHELSIELKVSNPWDKKAKK